MSEYPCFKYHKTKPAFICASEEFFNTLIDKDEYENLPFTGPRAIKPKLPEAEQCKECLMLEADNCDLKLENERLKIAIKMHENKLTEIEQKLKAISIPAKTAGRPKKVE